MDGGDSAHQLRGGPQGEPLAGGGGGAGGTGWSKEHPTN